jgi:cob(I)alamin adenosyltransferase
LNNDVQRNVGHARFIKGKPTEVDIAAAQKGLNAVKSAVSSGEFDIVILDEANVAVACGLLSVRDILDVIDIKPKRVEIVITGRGVDPSIIEKADLVTELKEIKHYYQKGIHARIGIEK